MEEGLTLMSRYVDTNELNLTYTKKQLLERLREVMPLCRDFDRAQTALHKTAEEVAYRKWLKDCAEWNRRQQKLTLEGYKRLAKRPALPEFQRENCPDSLAARRRRFISLVESSGKQRYSIGAYDTMYRLLTIDAPVVRDVC